MEERAFAAMYDISRFAHVTISRTAMEIAAEFVQGMYEDDDVPDYIVDHADFAFRQALIRFVHQECCDSNHCQINKWTPREPVEQWVSSLPFTSTAAAGRAIVSGHPSTMLGAPRPSTHFPGEYMVTRFYGLFVVFDLSGEVYEGVLDVVGDIAPSLLGEFSPGWPLAPGLELSGGPWYAGSRGFG